MASKISLIDSRKYECMFVNDELANINLAKPGYVRTREVKAGDMLNISAYPILVNYKLRVALNREMKSERARKAQDIVNARRAAQKICDLLDENFDSKDIFITLTYDYDVGFMYTMGQSDWKKEIEARKLPLDFNDVKRDKDNFIDRLKRHIKRIGGDPKTVKFLWVAEAGREIDDTIPQPLPRHYHLHIILSADVIRDRKLTMQSITQIWGKGLTQTASLQTDNNGLKRLAKYLSKESRQTKGAHMWGASRNLKNPKEKFCDRKVSKKKLEAIAKDVTTNAKEIFAKLYPDYFLTEQPIVKYSNFTSGAYIYARLKKLEVKKNG